MSYYLKDPGAAIDYRIDWSAGYLAGQTIADSLWSVAPDEAGGLVASGGEEGPGRTTATLSGGIAGHVYRVTNRITLSDGRVDERTLTLRVEER
jgi:hypothetical protein